MAVTQNDAKKIIEKMLLIRLVEEEIIIRYGAAGTDQQMRCPVHLSIGQEAAAVGACHYLSAAEKIFSTHRCHAHYLAKGGDLDRMVLELHGKMGGCLDGRGGSMHLMDDAAGVAMSVPIVASSIPLAVGVALANKIDKKNQVALTFFGDASVEEGVFHESANFAALMQLPMIFVCENNLFSVYTHLDQRQPKRPLAELGRAHNLHTVTMNGNDVFAVAEAFDALIAQAKNENKPSLIVLDTYRHREHCGVSFDDHLGYRDAQEFKTWQAQDPMTIAFDTGIAKGWMTQAEIDAMRTTIKTRVEQSFEHAKTAALPTPDMARNYVYAA
jgi:TPP-dependent pyruvate/acetoin dehydrogenase alpha subunit